MTDQFCLGAVCSVILCIAGAGLLGFVPVSHNIYTCTVFTCIEQARERLKRAENIVFIYLNPSNTSHLEQRWNS
jgi:hypothetical protein